MDAWAKRYHFNAPNGFTLNGLEEIVQRVRPGWQRTAIIVPVSAPHKEKH